MSRPVAAMELSPAHAPLVPVAIALSIGILADRVASLPLSASLAGLFLGLAGWLIGQRDSSPARLLFLGLAIAAFGALHHHQYRFGFAQNDIGLIATDQPAVVRVRGFLADEPDPPGPLINDPLRSMPSAAPSRVLFHVKSLFSGNDWQPATGLIRLTVSNGLTGWHGGDEAEIVGALSSAPKASNPGERDMAEQWLDRQVTAQFHVRQSAGAMVRLSAAGWSIPSLLARLRGWGRQILCQSLPPDVAGVATALLLGDGSGLSPESWDRYVRTGVLHALAISGQHLVVLAAFVSGFLRLTGLRSRHRAIAISLLLLGYALMTGGRPPAMRAAVQVCVVCGAVIFRRVVMPANVVALAWIIVLLLQPTDISDAGCQLSFLCVVVLTWGTARWFARCEPDNIEQLIDENRSPWIRMLRSAGRAVALSYGVTLALGLAVVPLAAAKYHMVSLAGFIIGPPVVLCTSAALIAGFLLLLSAVLIPPLEPLIAGLTSVSIRACEKLVDLGDRLPAGHLYVGEIPSWWLAAFYAGLIAALMLPGLQRYARYQLLVGLAWIAFGLGLSLYRPRLDELRVTFLAVGHGGCTVMETPDDRVILYDAGALSGPDVTRRIIAPFLWSRGIRWVDEVLVSHADLDHFNGLPALFERFRIGQVTLTPTFSDKNTPGVKTMLAALERRQIAVRIAQSGDVLRAGPLTLSILHPPIDGPAGPENVRSLVVLATHLGHRFLLTGDLEGAGMERLKSMPPSRVDVLMAPHHGSRAGDPAGLTSWCRPKVAVACQGPPQWPNQVAEEYEIRSAAYLGTWPHGAITFHSHATGLVLDTFRSRKRQVIATGSDP